MNSGEKNYRRNIPIFNRTVTQASYDTKLSKNTTTLLILSAKTIKNLDFSDPKILK